MKPKTTIAQHVHIFNATMLYDKSVRLGDVSASVSATQSPLGATTELPGGGDVKLHMR